jgi:ribulose-5-phosphate 4-epimerase/fuculose-1-phosphate aldolase
MGAGPDHGRSARPPTDPAGDLVRTVAALSRLGLIDLRGVGSVRLPTGAVMTSPRPGGGAPLPAELTTDDLVMLAADGQAVAGRWAPPLTIAADLEIYRRRPEVSAVVHGQPMTALAFAAAERPLAPLTHTESALVHPSLPVHGRGALVRTPEDARAFAGTLADRPVAILPGQGSIAVGGSVAEAGMLTHQVELLARVNEVAALQPDRGERGRTVPDADSIRISAQKAPAADFQDFFDQVIEGRTALPSPDPADTSEAGLRARIAAACHLLNHHGLVQSLEHVSVRLPGQDAFLMTPRRHLGRLLPAEIAVVGMDGQWRSGPLPPPPFLWLHRDMFAARPEVLAIVHTHQLLVRGLVMAGATIRPLYRGGAHWAATPAAVHETPDLMFDPDQRMAAMAILGDARVMHEVSHGSDFLAATVEEASVGALQLERQARLWALASRLGTPRPLDAALLAALPGEEPSDLDWWRYFRSELTSDG